MGKSIKIRKSLRFSQNNEDFSMAEAKVEMRGVQDSDRSWVSQGRATAHP